VAGTIGALDNGIGPVGVAPGARIWSVGVLGSNGSGSTADIIAGIDWVTANAGSIEVANMSLGGEFTSQALNDAITRSVNAGVVYVVAAGNSAKNAATFSPANHPDVITVSALADFNGLAGGGAPATCRSDVDDTLADFSNYGSVVEIAAPGVCIYSTWKSGGYNTISGTSMASPHVAGAAALIASVSNPNSRTDVMNIRAKLMADGNYNWVDDSPDGIKEPLLDVTGYDAR
jgi:subtilisin family serine protease